MPGYGEGEQFRFIAEPLRMAWFRQRDRRKRERFISVKKIALRARPLREVLELPELRGARLAESVKCAHANQVLHFDSARADAKIKIAKRSERRAFALAPVAFERGSRQF